MRFTDACAAAPVGSPTRASRSPARTRPPWASPTGSTGRAWCSRPGAPPARRWRRGDWKLIEFYEDGRRELYNLRDDLSEDRDLAAGNPDVARDLHEELAAWRETVAAKIPERKE